MAKRGEGDEHFNTPDRDDTDEPQVVSLSAFGNKKTTAGKPWRRAEGMGLEPTTHCWAPDFESDAACQKTREKSPVSDSCQQIASSGNESDADLAIVIAAWTELPDVVKAGILAMVKCASGD